MSALIISRSDWKSQGQSTAIVCYLGFSILCAETHLRAYMLYAHINTELGALVRPPMAVRSVGMVDPAQYKNGAFDRHLIPVNGCNLFQIFSRTTRGSALNKNTMMSTYRLHASPRPHRVVSQTSGVVPPTNRTLRRRDGTQTARQKPSKKIE